MNKYKLIVGLLLGLLMGGIVVSLVSPSRERPTRITVDGSAETDVAPDTALITLSVVTAGKQALNAQQENAARSEAVKNAVESVLAGSSAEIKTSDYRLAAEQDHYSSRTPKILGYTVRNTVTISTREMQKLGAVIDAATKAGANSVDGIRYVVGETSPSQGEALARATRQAMAKAEAVAKALQGHVVRVIETSESGVSPRGNAAGEASSNYSMMANTAAMQTPIEPGSVKMRSQVALVVEIGF